MGSLSNLFVHFWSITNELSPWFLLGALLAGIMTAVLPKTLLKRRMSGYSGVVTAVGFGVPLPLCSCAVIPTGIGLRRGGASEGASIGFLVSTPQTGLDSVLVTAAFLGWTFAFYKVAVALFLGILAGWILVWADQKKKTPPEPNPSSLPVKKSLPIISDVVALETKSEVDSKDETSGETSCCHGEGHGNDSDKDPNLVVSVYRASAEVMRSIYLWLLIGIFISAVLSTFLTSDMSQWISEQPLAMQILAMLGISAPLYVCATASVPIASAFVAKGISVGSTLVFLMAGPATNLATMGAVWKSFSRKAFWTYLAIAVLGSVAFALAFDSVFDLKLPTKEAHLHHHNTPLGILSSIILLGGCLWFFVKDAIAGKLISRLRLH